MTETTLTILQAYEAMYEHLSNLYERTGSSEVAVLLSDMSLLSDGKTADPAAWGDWLTCVHRAIAGKVDTSLRFVDDDTNVT